MKRQARLVTALVALALTPASARGESELLGSWRGSITAGDTTSMVIDLSRGEAGLEARFVAIVEGREVRGEFVVVDTDGGHLRLETSGRASVLDGAVASGVYSGTYVNARGTRGTFRFEREGGNGEAVAQNGEVRRIVVPAPSLRGSLIGESDTQPALVYLPAGYGDEPERRYPVLYLLHGIAGSPDEWIEVWNLPAILDRLRIGGEITDLIVVMPNGHNRYLGGYYVDSPVTGNWGQFVARDLVDHVDREFRTVADRSSRAIAGHSMGGFGAIAAGMSHADRFSIVYAMSPCCLAAVEDIGYGNVAYRTALGFAGAADVEAALERGDFYAVAVVGLLSALMPDPANAPLFVDFPVEERRGELMPTASFSTWEARFPLHRIDDRRAALLTLSSLVLEYGIADQFAHIPVATAEFSRELSANRIPHALHVFDGDHREQLPERLKTTVLPSISAALAAASEESPAADR